MEQSENNTLPAKPKRSVPKIIFVSAIRTFLAALLLVILLGGFLVWRLSSDPLDLQAARPVLQDLIARHLGAKEIDIQSLTLEWDGNGHLLIVDAGQINGQGIEGLGNISIDQLKFGLSADNLIIRQTVAPVFVTIDHLVASLTIPVEEPATEVDTTDPLINAASFLRLLKSGSVPEMSALKKVNLDDGAITLSVGGEGQSLSFSDINAEVDLVANEPVVDISGLLEQSTEPSKLTVKSTLKDDGVRLVLDTEISGLMPATIETVWPNDILEDLTQPWSLKAQTAFQSNADGENFEPGPITINLKADQSSTIDTPAFAKPLTVKSAILDAEIAANLHSVEVKQASLVIDDVSLKTTGEVAWKDELTADLRLATDSINAKQLLSLWPLDAVDKGREWVAENLHGGKAHNVDFHFQGSLEDADVLPGDALNGTFTFEDIEIGYVPTLPNASAVKGSAHIDLDKLSFKIESGSTGDVNVRNGSIILSKLRVPNVPNNVAVKLDLSADVPGTLRFLALPPLDVTLPNDVMPEDTSGEVEGQVDLNLPTKDDLSPEEIEGTIDLQLEKVEIPNIQKGFDLGAGSFEVRNDGKTTQLDGQAEINGKPADINLTHYQDGSEPIALTVKSRLDPSDFVAFGLDTGGWVEGSLDLQLEVKNFIAPQYVASLTVDLKETKLTAPALGRLKEAGTEGKLNVAAEIREGQVRISKMSLVGDELNVSGNAVIVGEPWRLQRLAMDQIAMGKTDVTANVRIMNNGSLTIDIGGKTLDLAGLLSGNGQVNSASEQSSDDEPPEIPPIVVNLNIDELFVGGIALPEVQAFFRKSVDGQTWATLAAKNPRGKKVSITLAPENDHYRLIGEFDDLGGIIEVLGSEERYVRGGDGTLDIRLDKAPPAIKGIGSLRVNEFRLENAPITARILSLASLTGIGDLLRGKGLQFDVMEVQFNLDQTEVVITKSRLAGSQIGATANGTIQFEPPTLNIQGTVVPVRGLNNVLANIPIIGRVLAGRDGEGAFVATYNVVGPAADPSVTVNPLSVIVPGIIRDIFGDAIGHGGDRQPVPTGR